MTTGGIKVVLTSPRVAPGLLTRAAWQVLGDADEIGASGGPARPDVQAVVGSGLVVSQIEGGFAEAWTWLSAAAASGRQVVWLVGEDGEPGLLRVVADQLSREPRPSYDVEILHGSYDVPGARLIDLVRVMDRLRRNCPWDQEQTHESLAKYLLEETYETLEAIDTGNRPHLREELGDLLLQVAFHSRIAEESVDDGDGFSIDDVSADIVEKLIRRHPHVFGTVDAADAAAVEANWETIKAAEKQRSSVLEGIPLALPALALADKVLGRAAKALPAELTPAAPGTEAERIGMELLALVREARTLDVDAEQALRTAILQLTAQIRAAETS
ncbi:MazG family protein [Kribbella capetownensis]|uniref:MazG family protein n=1 Tax=Kribbella capetownensis TaxID=1572659 RepID=A0A4R0JKM5_9ACTN|nr:MazG family protein [Kribbella capetownensis]TCC46860.1 MazG family protein [Kribbella capetownensis]